MSEMRSAEDILARRLDQVLPPDSTSLPPLTPDPLVNMAARFARSGIAEPSDVALARMEAVVLAAFDRQYGLQRKQSRRWVIQVAKWAVAACLIFALLAAGAVPASAGSLPGEPLYWVKLAAERVELVLATTPESAALVHLNHAERRATEVLGLLDRNQFDQTLLNTALDNLRNAAQLASTELASSRTYQWQQQQVSALVQYAAVQAENSGFDVSPIIDALPTLEPPPVLVPNDETPTPSPTASHTPSPTATASATPSQTSTLTVTTTATSTAAYTPSRTATTTPESTGSRTPSPTSTATPRRTVTRTPSTGMLTQTPLLLPPAAVTPLPSEEPVTASECPGNSCDSAGVPGGQINPEAPPGQSGGRDDNPPDPPGQGDPGGGQGNNPGQGNSGDNSGGSSQGQPPSDSGTSPGNSGGNSGNSGDNSGNGQGNGQDNNGNSGSNSGNEQGNSGNNGNGGGNSDNGQGNSGNNGNSGGNSGNGQGN